MIVSHLTLIQCSKSSSDRRGSRSDLVGRSAGLDLSLLSQAHHSVSSVQGSSDLLVSLHEALELHVQILVLTLEDGAMLVNGIALSLDIVVSLEEILVVKSEVLLLFSGHH